MTDWQITSWLYRHFRKLPPFYSILQAENTNLKQLLSELPTVPERILDLGAGHGNAGRIFFQNSPVSPRLFIAIDHEWSMLKQLTPLFSYCPCQAAAETLPLKNECIHLVLAIGLSEYLPDHINFLSEINRVMSPESYAVITIAPPGPANYLRKLLGHSLFFSNADQFRVLAEQAGFQLVRVTKSWLQTQFLFKKKGNPIESNAL
ncbi:methyltransferase domain-containing protein [bacterium]|nr:methyltransferase domain-containing protein [bacterium]